jgi:transcription-repair coupling factor (superfamily II helicase)
VLDFPAWDCLPYDRVSPNPGLSARRMATLAALAEGIKGPFVLLTTLTAATQRLPARDLIAKLCLSARVGDRVDEARLKGFLTRMGFSPASTVAEPGDFAIRGGIVDIWPPGSRTPIRLDFFGDVLDGARRFDPETQRTTEKLTAIDLAPMSEVILDEAAITRFRQNPTGWNSGQGDRTTRSTRRSAPGASIRGWNIGCPSSMTGWKRSVRLSAGRHGDAGRPDHPGAPCTLGGIEDQYDARREAMQAKGRLDSVYKPCAPGLAVSRRRAWEAATASHRVIQLSPNPQSPRTRRARCRRADGAQFRARTAAGKASAFSGPWPPI